MSGIRRIEGQDGTMTDTSLPRPRQAPEPQRVGPGSVSARRTGTRTYEGRNERGDTVKIGPADAPGHFTPGELLKIALAGCAGMSSDRVISRRLGDDYEATVWAHGTSDPAEERYIAIDEEILLGLDELDPSELAKLSAVIRASIDRSCTIARSVKSSIELSKTLNNEPLH
jgi:uncharacterized OsmC-like protein